MRRRHFSSGLGLLLLLGFFVSFAGMAGASEKPQLRVAPLSPAFLAYRENLERGGASSHRGVNSTERRTGYVPHPVDLSHLGNADYSAYFAAQGRRGALPASFDLRNENAVTQVRDQGNTGMCWAIAAIGSMESLYRRGRGAALDLSPMHLAYYTYKIPGGFNPLGYVNVLDSGGNDLKATAMLARWVGPVLERDAPFGVMPSGSYDRYANQLHLQDVYFANALLISSDQSQRANDIRKELIRSHGAISIAYAGNSRNTAFNEANSAWYNRAAQLANHSVLAVGWDDNYDRENFNETMRPARDGAWLLRNSWGTGFGQDGYFWLSYEDASIVDGAAYLSETTTNYDNLYDYDTLGLCTAVGLGLDRDAANWMANVFTARGPETLKAVSFYTMDANASYEISVYTGLRNGGSPTGGARAFSPQKGSQVFAGYHTVELETPVPLARGMVFSVVVKMTTPAYDYPLALETAMSYYSENATANRDESFFSLNGAQWESGGTEYNACIKAFTTNGSTAPEPTEPTGPTTESGGGGCAATGGALLIVALLPLLPRKR